MQSIQEITLKPALFLVASRGRLLGCSVLARSDFMKQTPDGVVFSKSRYGWDQAYFVIDKSRDANRNFANEFVVGFLLLFLK